MNGVTYLKVALLTHSVCCKGIMQVFSIPILHPNFNKCAIT